jgi:PAS domain S-box-containing protein
VSGSRPRRPRRKRLAAKLAALAIVPFGLLSALLLWGLTYQFEHLSDAFIGSQQSELSRSMVQELDGKVRVAHDLLGACAGHFAAQPADPASIQAWLERQDHLLPSFDQGLQVSDLQHHVIASVGPIRNRPPDDQNFVFPMSEPNRLVSLPFESRSIPGHPAVAQTVPILSHGQIWGYLSGAFDLSGPRYLGSHPDARLGSEGYFSLTAPNRVLIMHRDPKRVLKFGGGVGSNPAIDRGFDGYEGWMHTTTVAGLPMITAVRMVPSAGWLLAVNFPRRIAEAPFESARRNLLLAVVIGTMALLALVLAMSRRLTKPLVDMTHQVEALTKGEGNVVQIPVTSYDELGRLSEAFNRLAKERSQAEGALRASEERFRLAFRTSPEAMTMSRLDDGVLVAVNESFERLFQVCEADALGHSLADLHLLIPPIDNLRDWPVESLRDIEVQVITAKGRKVDLSVSCAIVKIAGEPHVLAVCRDVTALRAADAERERLTLALQRSEARHRLVVRNVPVVQWALDNDGRFTLAEGRGLVVFGFNSDEIVRANLFTLFRDNAQVLEYFAQAKQGQVVSGSFDYGASVFDSHWGPLRDESGSIVGVTAIAWDVTERRQAERAQKETETRFGLLERLAATGRLAAGVAHEINNPLTYVIANLKEVRSRLPPGAASEELLRCIEEATDGAVRVAAIVRDLRVFARGPAEGQTRCDPVKVAESAATLAWNQIRHRATLQRDLQPTPNAAISDGRLAQVLVNLLMNACLAIPEGKLNEHFIRLSVRHLAPWIVIEVTDSGVGMGAETLAHLFEPFFTTREPGEGMGLGLALCHTIVTEAGGTIEAESTLGQGTSLRLRLPEATAGEVTNATAVPNQTHTPDNRRLHLLVIDDDPLVGRAVARQLREHDVVVETRSQSALERLRSGEFFDAILCDLMMPELSGIQLYQRLRRERPEVTDRMLFMSGGAFGEEAEAFVHQMGTRVFEKPWDLPVVSRRLREVAETTRPAAPA